MCDRPGCEVEYGSECDCHSEEQESWIVFNSINGEETKFPSRYLAIKYAQLRSKKDVLSPDLEVIPNAYHTVFTVGNYSIYYDY